jgi:hypothetical protein
MAPFYLHQQHSNCPMLCQPAVHTPAPPPSIPHSQTPQVPSPLPRLGTQTHISSTATAPYHANLAVQPPPHTPPPKSHSAPSPL